MKKLAHIISAWIYIVFMRLVAGWKKEDILEGQTIEEFGTTLMFSWFIYLTLFIITLYAVVGSIAYVWTYIYLNYFQ